MGVLGGVEAVLTVMKLHDRHASCMLAVCRALINIAVDGTFVLFMPFVSSMNVGCVARVSGFTTL